MKTSTALLMVILGTVILAGCQSTSQSVIKDEPFVIDNTYKSVKPAPQPPAGTIYRGVNANSNFLGDHRARGVGDIITVKIYEVTNASEKAGTKTAKHVHAEQRASPISWDSSPTSIPRASRPTR